VTGEIVPRVAARPVPRRVRRAGPPVLRDADVGSLGYDAMKRTDARPRTNLLEMIDPPPQSVPPAPSANGVTCPTGRIRSCGAPPGTSPSSPMTRAPAAHLLTAPETGGRVDQVTKSRDVRPPEQVTQLREVPAIASAQFVVTRTEHDDHMEMRIVLKESTAHRTLLAAASSRRPARSPACGARSGSSPPRGGGAGEEDHRQTKVGTDNVLLPSQIR